MLRPLTVGMNCWGENLGIDSDFYRAASLNGRRWSKDFLQETLEQYL